MNNELESVQWLAPWEAALSEELVLDEAGPDHPLHNVKVRRAARRLDCDDALFFVPGAAQPWALVHLTYTKNAGSDWPHTQFYATLNEWVDAVMWPDYTEFTS